ncbi:glycoside hydrolase family 3 N-terminal domain-containing protein [Candidatus Neomarinimicrobiota bacterium]
MWTIRRRTGAILLTGVWIIIHTTCAPRPEVEPEGRERISMPVTADDLSLRQQIAQLIMVRVEGIYYSSDSRYYQNLRRWVEDDGIGGVITYRGTVDGTFSNLRELQGLASIPLLVAADLERGLGQQMTGGTSFTSNMGVAATFNEQNAYDMGRITAVEGRAVGIHVAFAPVMDVNNNPDNPIINFRSYSDDPYMVSRMGTAFIRGMQENGMAATAKHYPGHGNTNIDSHTSLPIIPGSRDDFEGMELIPFVAAETSGVKMIMTAHIAVPGIDASNQPATLSPIITQQLLREDLGYEGVIVTDGLEMGAITSANPAGEAAVKALEAGNDILLLPVDVEQTIEAIATAVRQGRLSRERIATSVNRVLRLKAELGLYEERDQLTRENIRQHVGLADNQATSDRIAQESITLVKDEREIIPFLLGEDDDLTHILISMDSGFQDRTEPFWRNVQSTLGSSRVQTTFVNDVLDQQKIHDLVVQARSTTRTLVTALVRIVMNKGGATIDPSHQALLDSLYAANVPFALVTFGSPYLPSLERVPAYLSGYAYYTGSMQAMANALFGRAPISGRLPVNLGGGYERGHGLTRDAVGQVFGDARGRYDFSGAFSVIDSAIHEFVMPGAQVFVLKDGEVVADTAFGYFTYNPGAPPITKESIFDLASVTKVLVGTPIAMSLVDDGLIALDDPVQKYFPEFQGEGKDSVTIWHILTHTSGLPDYTQYWVAGIRPDQVISRILQTRLLAPPGETYLYSDLGLILFTALAEKITGKSIDQLAREIVFDPLHMQYTAYNPPREWLSMIVPTEIDMEGRRGTIQGVVHDGNSYFLGGTTAHAGVFTQARELAKLGQLMLNNGMIYGRWLFRASTVLTFTHDQHIPGNYGRGIGWAMAYSTVHGGDLFSYTSYGHTGFTGTSIWIDPDRNLVTVLLTNRVYPTRDRGGHDNMREQFHNAVAMAVDRPPILWEARPTVTADR